MVNSNCVELYHGTGENFGCVVSQGGRNDEDNQWTEILGAAFVPAILLVIVFDAEGQEALVVWEHIWQAVCRQPQIFLSIYEPAQGRGWGTPGLDQPQQGDCKIFK